MSVGSIAVAGGGIVRMRPLVCSASRLVIMRMLYKTLQESWALSSAQLQQLEVFHRQRLRMILGIRHPDRVSNDELYRQCLPSPSQHCSTAGNCAGWDTLVAWMLPGWPGRCCTAPCGSRAGHADLAPRPPTWATRTNAWLAGTYRPPSYGAWALARGPHGGLRARTGLHTTR